MIQDSFDCSRTHDQDHKDPADVGPADPRPVQGQQDQEHHRQGAHDNDLQIARTCGCDQVQRLVG